MSDYSAFLPHLRHNQHDGGNGTSSGREAFYLTRISTALALRKGIRIVVTQTQEMV